MFGEGLNGSPKGVHFPADDDDDGVNTSTRTHAYTHALTHTQVRTHCENLPAVLAGSFKFGLRNFQLVSEACQLVLLFR